MKGYGFLRDDVGCAGGFARHERLLLGGCGCRDSRAGIFATLLGGLYGGGKIRRDACMDGGHEGGLAGEGGEVFLEEGAGAAVEGRVWVWVNEEAGDGLIAVDQHYALLKSPEM